MVPSAVPLGVSRKAETGECENQFPVLTPYRAVFREGRSVCNDPAFICLLFGLTYPMKPVYFCFPLKDKGLVLLLEGKLTISVIPLAIQGSVTFRGAAAES